MKKRMLIMLISVGILFAFIFGYKGVTHLMNKRFMTAHSSPAMYVSTAKAEYLPWQPQLNAAGSLRAVMGVNVTTELAGMVRTIYFTPGAIVNKGDLLVQLDIDPDTAQLHSLEANAEIASITYHRDLAQYKVKGVSKEQVDTDLANLKSANAQVAQQVATIAQKTITAPFTGRVGICVVNPGQYINPGQKVTMLQTLDPMYVDFYLPQQQISQVKINQPVSITVDGYPGKAFTGKITTVDPGLDPDVRNVEVEATIANPDNILAPGMFANVIVNAGSAEQNITLPITAVSFNSYGDVVYVVKQKGQDKNGKPILTANQRFVITGKKRGDQIVISSGIKAGDVVVTSGQLKLKNGSVIMINNTVKPMNNETSTFIDT